MGTAGRRRTITYAKRLAEPHNHLQIWQDSRQADQECGNTGDENATRRYVLRNSDRIVKPWTDQITQRFDSGIQGFRNPDKRDGKDNPAPIAEADTKYR